MNTNIVTMNNKYNTMNPKMAVYVQILLAFITTEINLNCVFGEWVELPQFSKEFKVYRLTDSNDDFAVTNYKNIKNSSMNILSEKYDKTKKIVKSRYSDEERNVFLSRKKTMSDNTLNTNLQDISIFKMPSIIVTEKNNHFVFPKLTTHLNLEQDEQKDSSKSKILLNAKNDTNGTISYSNFPLKLFNVVHEILLSNHARTFETKNNYLNRLRENLLEDIDVILKNLKRVKRNKRSYYSEEQDQHIGFPSLEGALLAISFLTFSVYLIQLVMMLLRNISSNPTSTGTVLVNRNRRYIDDLQNSTRICEYISEYTCR